jgi:hypothetical protein
MPGETSGCFTGSITPWLSAHSGCVKRQASFFSLCAVRPFLRMIYSLYF